MLTPVVSVSETHTHDEGGGCQSPRVIRWNTPSRCAHGAVQSDSVPTCFGERWWSPRGCSQPLLPQWHCLVLELPALPTPYHPSLSLVICPQRQGKRGLICPLAQQAQVPGASGAHCLSTQRKEAALTWSF